MLDYEIFYLIFVLLSRPLPGAIYDSSRLRYDEQIAKEQSEGAGEAKYLVPGLVREPKILVKRVVMSARSNRASST